MNKNLSFDEALMFCTGAQENKDVTGWRTLKEYETFIPNPSFDAKVYQQGNDIVIAYAGTNTKDTNDLINDMNLFFNKISTQYQNAKDLHAKIKHDFPNANIKLTGYSLGGTLANMVSCETGTPSTAIAPIGGKAAVSNNKYYFKYGDKNVVSYGHSADLFFGKQLNDQLGSVKLLPNANPINSIAAHLLHNFKPNDAELAVEWHKKPTLKARGETILNSAQQAANAFNQTTQNLVNSIKDGIQLQGQNLQQMINNAQDYVQNMQPILNNFSSHENKPYINMDVPTPLNDWYTKSKEDVLNLIASMPIDEFNARQVEIMNYFNPTQKSQQKAQIFENYATVANALKRIITKEDVNNMSIDEFNNNWDEIKTQMSKIGVPSEKELPQNIMTYTKQKQYEDYSNKDGRWVTIKGNHVFIES